MLLINLTELDQMGFRDYKYKWVSKLECNVNQYLVGKAEDYAC